MICKTIIYLVMTAVAMSTALPLLAESNQHTYHYVLKKKALLQRRNRFYKSFLFKRKPDVIGRNGYIEAVSKKEKKRPVITKKNALFAVKKERGTSFIGREAFSVKATARPFSATTAPDLKEDVTPAWGVWHIFKPMSPENNGVIIMVRGSSA